MPRISEQVGIERKPKLGGGGPGKIPHRRGYGGGDVLQGVRYQGRRGATTESLVMRTRSGTVRRVYARHDRDKLRALIGGDAAYG